MKRIFTIEKFLGLDVVFFSVLLLASCNSSKRIVGVEEGWEVLGQRKVNFVRDKDVINVKSRNMFTAIRFRVEDRDIRISDLKVYYINGDKLEPSINEDIAAGQSSKIIELARDGRYIEKIEFKYRTTGNLLKGRAQVIVLGRRFNPYGY